MTLNIQLIIIDPQYDFCHPDGSLFVPGSVKDMERISTMIYKLNHCISDIHVTLDSHHPVDIAHAEWFIDQNNNHPDTFSQITADDIRNEKWLSTDWNVQQSTLQYLNELEEQQRYSHVIWPHHCVIGTKGATIVTNINDALTHWASKHQWVNFIIKGMNPYTEHFSAIKAEVPDFTDKSTQVNLKLINKLEEADMIIISGEAGSHCVANTCIDIADNFLNPESVKKMILLKDAISPVTGFEDLQNKFVTDMVKRGMNISTTDKFIRNI